MLPEQLVSTQLGVVERRLAKNNGFEQTLVINKN